MNRQVQLTADGSHTVHVHDMNVTYHSKHGALQESRHVFIDAGIAYLHQLKNRSEYHILEMGFGTGLNALLTASFSTEKNIQIRYHSIEAFPLTTEEAALLNYGHILQQDSLFLQIHQASWDIPVPVHPNFELYKHNTSLDSFTTKKKFDIIYYDAFAPTAQPELWTVEVFEKLYQMLAPEGILITYCSKGVVRRAMQTAGFRVTKLQGPPGKREMVRAFRDQ